MSNRKFPFRRNPKLADRSPQRRLRLLKRYGVPLPEREDPNTEHPFVTENLRPNVLHFLTSEGMESEAAAEAAEAIVHQYVQQFGLDAVPAPPTLYGWILQQAARVL